MKKISTIILSLLFAAVFTLPIFASAATSPGVKPGNFFYFFDTSFEKIGLFFTFSPEKKARRALQYADERLAEIEGIAEEKDTDAVKTAISNYENNVALAAEKSKEVTDKAKAESLLTAIEDKTEKNQEVLSVVLTKVPEEAREAILRAISASKKGQEEAAKQIAELKGEVEKLKQEVEELKTKDEEREKVIDELSKPKVERPVTQQKISAPVAPTQKPEQAQTQPKTSIVTLPSGAVVEMDANGKILQYIKEAPVNTAILTKPNSDVLIYDLKVVPTPADGQKNVSTVRIEWKTNVPAESKIFLTDSDGIVRLYTSQTGLSTNHFISVGSFEGVTYRYEIEAIGKDGFVKQSGKFIVQERPTPIATKMKIKTDRGESMTFYDSDGGGCSPFYFEVSLFDKYGNTMFGHNVTIETPLGTLTKTIPETSLIAGGNSYAARFWYTPMATNTTELITLTSGNFLATTTIILGTRIAEELKYLENGIFNRFRKYEDRVWRYNDTDFDMQTGTCIVHPSNKLR